MSGTLNESKLTLILLPGMDGTGELFERFLSVLPEWIQPKVVRYPPCQPLPYTDLLASVRSTLPANEPFVVLAESFSTPIAIRLAAEGPPNLKALIICAGFIESPIRGVVRLAVSLLAPILFRIPPPGFAIRTLLVGRNASADLVRSTRTTISSVSPGVLLRRLRDLLRCDERERLANIAAPLLYIRANQDHIVGRASLDAIKSVKPSVTIARIDGPHLIVQREPEAVVGALTEFLNELL
jgi:pimeloyl-ACP methyl ester carboxylesterase